MKNFFVLFSDVSGSGYIYDGSTGEEIIQELMGNDIRPPLTNMYIEAKTIDGKIIRISVPNSKSEEASVEIE